MWTVLDIPIMTIADQGLLRVVRKEKERWRSLREGKDKEGLRGESEDLVVAKVKNRFEKEIVAKHEAGRYHCTFRTISKLPR